MNSLLARYYPIVAITGPRQAGKTTLARAVFPDRPYASLEDPDVRTLAATDARGFLSQFPDGAVIDEAQRVPELFSYLQTLVDGDRRMGRFVLTGSQHFGLMEGISQSLAGRVGLLHLMPFGFDEISGTRPDDPLEDWFPPLARFHTLAQPARTFLLHGGESGQPRSRTPVFGWRSIARAMDVAFQES